jgi:hypothetical protein
MNAKRNLYAAIYNGCILAGFIIFCGLLRWQPWNSRLHLPLFILTTPIIGLVLEKYAMALTTKIWLLVLIVASIPYLFYNEARPLLSKNSLITSNREEFYIYHGEKVMDSYNSAASMISNQGCNNIGVIMNFGDYEYVLWMLLRKYCGNRHFRLEHILVENESALENFRLAEFEPEIILTFGQKANPSFKYHNRDYGLFQNFDFINMYKK